MDKTTISHEDEQKSEEEVSLCDFAMNFPENDECSDEDESSSPTIFHRRSSPSHPSDFFEFYNGHSWENAAVSHAEDIFSCGKLVPHNHRPLLDDRILNSLSAEEESSLSRRYCKSLPELKSSSSAVSDWPTRSSRSLDCEKRRRNLNLAMKSGASDIRRSFSKDSLKSEGCGGSKPPWYALMFGIAKFPPEMELRDIKNRQFRRQSGNTPPAAEAGERTPVNRRSSWGDDLLRLLSCRSSASVTVTAPNALRNNLREVLGPQHPRTSSPLTVQTVCD